MGILRANLVTQGMMPGAAVSSEAHAGLHRLAVSCNTPAEGRMGLSLHGSSPLPCSH